MKTLIKNFMKCGIMGWCLEIIFTALGSFHRKDLKLKGNTSLWMFPIYGIGCLIAPISFLLKKASWFTRGTVYTLLIYTVEYISGIFLKKRKLCPWDYSRSHWNIDSVIRLDYIPCWFATGLLMEKIVQKKEAKAL